MKKFQIFSVILGNIFDHYDNALFGFLTPFISKLFFPNFSYINSLIITYSFLTFGIIARPLGSIFFGYIGDIFGRKKILVLTLIGMGTSTFLMGLITA